MRTSDQLANPWNSLPRIGPFVLPEDRATIENFNQTAGVEHQVRLEVLPVPFLGSLESAKVVLLNLNPGIVEQDFEIFHSDKDYVEQNRLTLTFQSDPSFFYLNERFSYTEGYKWWFKRLRELINICGQDVVASRVMCVQFFPYHSEKYRKAGAVLSSQHFGFTIVRRAIEAKKTIIIMRSYNRWIEQVPELQAYPHIRLINPRSPYITPNNMPASDFAQIVSAINEPGQPSRSARRFMDLFRAKA